MREGYYVLSVTERANAPGQLHFVPRFTKSIGLYHTADATSNDTTFLVVL